VNNHLLLEAAVRSLVMGAIVFLVLRAMRIEQVRARRTAWLLVLAGALAMPALVGAQIGPRLLPVAASRPQAARISGETYIPATPDGTNDGLGARPQLPLITEQGGYHAVEQRDHHAAEQSDRHAAPQRGRHTASQNDRHAGFTSTLWSLAVIGYCAVAAVLSLRLCTGIGLALRLRNQAERVVFPFDPELDVRVSSRIATPVTIGWSVLLPVGYDSWDDATLRIVLSHERAHVRQSDFYVHALAGLHTALFWFNPLSWWLQRQLAELGEALSDCAAVEQAESRTTYAETLLAFATHARAPLACVAMASASSLAPRIERLLSDHRFERSFAGKHRLPYVAAGVVMMAMVAATSMARVQAAPTGDILNAVAPVPAAPSSLAVSLSPAVLASAVVPLNPAVPASPGTPPTPVAPPTPVVPASSVTPATPAVPASTNGAVDADTNGTTNTNTYTKTDKSSVGALRKSAKKADAQRVVHDEATEDSHEDGVTAINTDHSHTMFNFGNTLPSQLGDYIYFQHDGKPYLIQDPAIMAQAQAMLAPMKALGEQQRELGRKQRELAIKQARLGAQQSSLAAAQVHAEKIDTPEFKRDMAQLKNVIKEMRLDELTAQIDRNALAEVQAQLAQIQAMTGKLTADMDMQQADLGGRQGALGAQQGELGEQQGKLGEQQALLGEQQRKIAEEVRRQLKPIIEQAIREGKGKPITEP